VCVWSLAGYTNLKVEEETITSTPGFALADDDGRHRCANAKVGQSCCRQRKKNIRTLLTEFWFSLLHGCHDHVTDTSIRKAIQMRARAKWFYDKEGLCAAVVCAVEDGTDGQTEGKPEFVAGSSCACGRLNEDKNKSRTGRGETYRAWTFCSWIVFGFQWWMILDDCGARVVQFIGICRRLPLCHVLFLFWSSLYPYLYSDPLHCQDAHLEFGQLSGRDSH
jgi:hypothetical protein